MNPDPVTDAEHLAYLRSSIWDSRLIAIGFKRCVPYMVARRYVAYRLYKQLGQIRIEVAYYPENFLQCGWWSVKRKAKRTAWIIADGTWDVHDVVPTAKLLCFIADSAQQKARGNELNYLIVDEINAYFGSPYITLATGYWKPRKGLSIHPKNSLSC